MGIRSYGPKPALSRFFESAQQAIVANGFITIAHGLGTAPKVVQYYLVNVTAWGGWNPGDILPINQNMCPTYNNQDQGIGTKVDASNITIRIGNQALATILVSNGSESTVAVANWKLVVRAWA